MTKLERVLNILEDGQWHFAEDLRLETDAIDIPKIISDLRRVGHAIENASLKKTEWGDRKMAYCLTTEKRANCSNCGEPMNKAVWGCPHLL